MKPSNDRASGLTEATDNGIDSKDVRRADGLLVGYPFGLVSGLFSEIHRWQDDEREHAALCDELCAYALSTFVDGVPVTPTGVDDTEMLRPDVPVVATNGGLDEDTRDVLIHAGASDLAHKRPDKLGDDEVAYWTVSGTPRQTEPGRQVWFEYDDIIHAHGEITAVEDGRIYFDAAKETHVPCLDDAPTRGFTYIDPLVPRLDDTDWHVEPTGETVVATDGGATPHATAEPGDTLHEADGGGPIAARVSDLEPGHETKTVTVDAMDLYEAVDTHHPDDYPSVHLHTDGEQLFVTDHESPFEGADEPHWDEFDGDVVREPVVYRPDDVVRALIDRDALRASLDEFDVGDEIDVLVEDNRPVYLTDGDTSVGIAPQVPDDEAENGGENGD